MKIEISMIVRFVLFFCQFDLDDSKSTKQFLFFSFFFAIFQKISFLNKCSFCLFLQLKFFFACYNNLIRMRKN